MLKIIITDDKIDFNENDNIKIKEFNDSFIKKISLDILNDSTLEIEYNIKDNIKLNLLVNIHDNVKCTIIDKKLGNTIKAKYDYVLGVNSNLIINKINDCQKVKEYDKIDLNGTKSNVKYVLKTICKDNENYDIIVNHHSKDSISSVITNGLNIMDGSLNFNVTGFVPKGSENACLTQDNRIVNLTNNKCGINPNLLIDEVSVDANHSAHIGNFSDENLFYIESRGISRNDAMLLLISGFLNNNLEIKSDYIDNLVKKYWR